MAHVFLSFANDCLPLARQVREALAERGVDCYLANDDIDYGMDIVRSLEDELRVSPVLMPIVSESYLKSAWTQRERSAHLFADSASEIRVIMPLVVNEFDEDLLPPMLRPLKYLRIHVDKDGGIVDLAEVADRMAPQLRKLLSTSPAGSYERFARERGINSLIVVESTTGEALYESLGRGAAGYFERNVSRNFRVGLACANTIYQMVKNVRPFRLRMSAFPISFNLEPEMTNVLSAYATLIALWNLNPDCTPYVLPVPPFFTDTTERTAFESRPDIADVLNQARDLNMAFYSCGYFGPGSSFDIHTAYIKKYLDKSFSVAELQDLGAIGEINLCPYSLAGDQIAHPLLRSFFMLELARIRELASSPDRHMVLVAGGPHKVKPLVGAIRGRYLNVLVTDKRTLDAVIDLDQEESV